MPVILPRDSEGLWLDTPVEDPELLGRLLRPYESGAMDTYEVSALVNSVRNDGPDVAARADPSNG